MKKSVLIVVAFASVCAQAADVITLIRWDRLFTYSGNQTSATTTQYDEALPPGWSIAVADNEGTLQVTASASRRKYQVGVLTNDWSGRADFLFNIITDKPTNSKFSLSARHTGTATANATVLFPDASAYGRGSTTYPPLKTREVKANMIDIADEDSLGPRSITKSWNFAAQTWYPMGGGLNQIDVVLSTGKIAGKGVATCPGGGGNSIASVGQGNAIEKLKVLALKMSPPTGNAGFISGTRDSFIDDLQIEVRSEFNALVENCAVGGLPITWDLPFDYADGTYRLIFWAPGSLRKRVDVTYIGATGVSGVGVNLYWGDIDWNNTITQAEIDAIANNSGRTWAQAGWRDEVPGIGCRYMDCDLNQDNQITAADYLLAVGNAGRVGD